MTLRLVFTEKSTRLWEKDNKYVFDVDRGLTKLQIRLLVYKIFSVPVTRVNTFHLPPRTRRSGNLQFIRKRAVITVKKGTQIKLFS